MISVATLTLTILAPSFSLPLCPQNRKGGWGISVATLTLTILAPSFSLPLCPQNRGGGYTLHVTVRGNSDWQRALYRAWAPLVTKALQFFEGIFNFTLVDYHHHLGVEQAVTTASHSVNVTG